MSRKPIRVRQAAHDDIGRAIDFYLGNAESGIADREHPDHVDVWRVLHAERDLPEALRILD